MEYSNWENYVSICNNSYFIRHSTSFPKTLVCSCPVGAKKQPCKHALVISCQLKYNDFPANITSVVIEGKRSPGRPKIATRGTALSRK